MASRGSRSRYQADLSSAIKTEVANVSNTKKADDGEFEFTFHHPLLPSSRMDFRVVMQEGSSYPSEHYFLVYSCDDAPQSISNALDRFLTRSAGLKVIDVIVTLSRILTAALEGSLKGNVDQDEDKDTPMTDLDDSESQEEDEGEDFEDFDFNDDDDDDNDAIFGLSDNARPLGGHAHYKLVAPTTISRIRRDFRLVRDAGFKVARLCGFHEVVEYSIMSISARVDKLCLSGETREAWDLKSEDFVVLMIRYNGQYTTFEDAIDRPSEMSNMQFCLRKCSKYKPSVTQAIKAFVPQNTSRFSSENNSQMSTTLEPDSLTMLGVGRTIDTFMGSDFVPMVKLRNSTGASWDVAKRHLMALSRTAFTKQDDYLLQKNPATTISSDDTSDQVKLPAFLTQDHCTSNGEVSLPLVAAQFAMRYLVRCTDYCMICHRQVEGNFESLKPYVCGDSLCLFQYMSMGCGPSIDHEIISQPNVVDLLISFCFMALQGGYRRQIGTPSDSHVCGLREFPNGLSLQVPNIRRIKTLLPTTKDAPTPPPASELDGGIALAGKSGLMLAKPMSVQLDRAHSTVELEHDEDVYKVREGNWVVVVSPVDISNNQQEIMHHARIENIVGRSLMLRFVSSHVFPILSHPSEEQNVTATSAAQGRTNANLVLYDQNMDDLDSYEKAFAMVLLLTTIPPVDSMRAYLIADRNRQIEKWNKLTPSAAKLLRWIVASNRSYIVQVGGYSASITDDRSMKPAQPEQPADQATNLARPEEQISGVDGWLQFRFAQGSPEKEVQFQEALKSVSTAQRTLLAWHGSNTANWHSIIRQGLNFEETHNGRAFGNGVYFSRDFNYSASYAHNNHTFSDITTSAIWRNSALRISGALSLNELINKPLEFTHSQSCYVVQHTHWIQCRYLFVKTQSFSGWAPEHVPSAVLREAEEEFVQDQVWKASGPKGQMFIPRKAIPSAQDKKPLSTMKQQADGHIGDSEDEDPEDIEFLRSDDEADPTTPAPIPMGEVYEGLLGKTDFRPGTLDLSTLPKLNPPSYATDQARKTIGREIKSLQKIQASTPLHELGWYIDFDSIDNMFRWIVELHSFDPTLPLAQDMKRVGMTSVVLEIRFGRDFPMSPPFVRVVRPRFLPFMNGGGGHVTAGGAMCMELLTNSGWSPVSSLESVLLQVRMAISSVDPKPARLEAHISSNRMDYGVSEAYDAYVRAAHAHGWKIPADLQESTTAMREHSTVVSDVP